MRTSVGFLSLFLASCAAAPPAPPVVRGAAPASGAERYRAAEAAAAPLPAAREDVVVENIHGIEVRDPYRWMEKGGEEMNAWLEAQGKRSRAVFDALPRRAEMLAAVTAADLGVTRVSIVDVVGDGPRIFLMKRKPEEEVSQLWVRDGWNGTDRMLVDPRTRDEGDVHHSIDYSAPSQDGKYIAYGISASGSEDSVI